MQQIQPKEHQVHEHQCMGQVEESLKLFLAYS
jgi:hypothetical protein